MGTKFVNREAELALVRGLMEEIERGQKPQEPVIGFYGPPGIGKTTLALRLTREASDWVCVSVADPARFQRSFVGPVKTVVIIDDLGEPFAVGSTVEIAIEELLLRNLAVVVAFAKHEPRWKRFEIRRRVQVHPLRPFTLEETAAQLGVAPDSAHARAIFYFSAGHPALNEELDRVVANTDVVGDWLLRTLLKRYHWGERELLPLLGLPCGFNVSSVRKLSSLVADDEKPFSEAAVMSFIAAMVEDGLVGWSSERVGYALRPPLRMILLRWLREAEPERFQAASQKLIELHEDWCRVFAPHLLADLLFLTAQAGGDAQEPWARWREKLAWVVDDGLSESEEEAVARLRGDTEWRQTVGDEIADAFFKTIDEAIASRTEME